MATKKDYILVAEALHKSQPNDYQSPCDHSSSYRCGLCDNCWYNAGAVNTFGKVIDKLVKAFKQDNSKFDEDKFRYVVYEN